jgi:uracil-DNA glycosylase family 4
MICTKCPLHLNAFTNCMQGVDRGRTLFVLPQPSAYEDLTGELDSSTGVGRLLRSICSDAGFRDEDVSIAFATRCRTASNDTATGKDIDACREHLSAQIKRIKPVAIVALGNEALRALCKSSGIKDKRGSSFPLHMGFDYACEVWPTYSVDEIIRVPTFRSVVTSDLRRVRDRNLPEPDTRYEVFHAGSSLPNSPVWAWDGEWAISGGIVDYFTMLSCDNGSTSYVAVGEQAIRAMLLQLLDVSLHGATLVTHNGWAADLKIARKWGYEMPYGEDTMVMAFLEDETQPQRLESLCVKYLGVRGWKNDSWEKFDPTSEEAAKYAARDSRYTYLLFHKLSELLRGRIHTIEHVLRPARIALDRQTSRGIWINPVPVKRERGEAERLRDDSLKKLRVFAGSKFNPGSTKQVGDYLTATGMVLPLTATRKPATGIEVLKSLSTPFAKTLVDYRSAIKTLSTYIAPYEKVIFSDDGRVHPDYTLTRTLTGRSSARNLNVQNLDRDLKEFFDAPPGQCFVSVDYSAIEFRLAAWFAREPTILEQYNADPNWDPHKFVAAMFYDVPVEEVTRAQRQIGKSANFGLLFLAGPLGLMEYANKTGVPMSLQKAFEMHSFWHDTFPGFRKFYKETRNEIETTGRSTCPTGHIRHFGDWALLLPNMRSEALRQAVNCKVQNFAAHLSYISMAELERQGILPVGFIHDAFLFEFKTEAEAGLALPKIEEIMTIYPKKFLLDKFGVTLDIALAVEAEVKTNAT